MADDTILQRAAQQAANYERCIQAQKETIDRLLQARGSETPDKELILELTQENTNLREQSIALMSRIDSVRRLIDVLEEGVQQINTDLVREALNG